MKTNLLTIRVELDLKISVNLKLYSILFLTDDYKFSNLQVENINYSNNNKYFISDLY